MPRQARLDMPGALHHIMVRGINRSAIFRDRQDRVNFLDRLGLIVTEGDCSVHAWVLMTNHVHLLFRSGQTGVSTAMRRLLTWYGQYYNHRYHRTGHLFENRYKSILCDEDKYLLALVRYIHLNPIRAKIINTLEELEYYPWSGHGAILGKRQLKWMDVNTVLGRLNSERKAARLIYRSFVAEGLDLGRNPDLTGGGLVHSQGGWSQVLSARRKGETTEFDERILGDGDFVASILRETEEKIRNQLKLKQTGLNLKRIIEEECQTGQIMVNELQGGSRRREVSAIREKVAARALSELGVALAEIARHTGVNTSSIARAVLRLKMRVKGSGTSAT